MLGRLRSLFRSLSFKLTLVLVAILVAGFAAHAILTLRSTRQEWTRLVYAGADRASQLIAGATHHGMLANRKDEVHRTIVKLAEGKALHAVRIYDKAGTIIFSARKAEVGRKVDLQAAACVACHRTQAPPTRPATRERVRIYRDQAGERVLGMITPIENQRACWSAACHAHPRSKTVLGVLDVGLSLAGLERAIGRTERYLIGTALALLLALIGLVAAFMHRTWARKLAEQVERKSGEVALMQRQALQLDKMASLGRLSATVAHELNNPLAGIVTYAKLVERSLGELVPPPTNHHDLERYLSVIQSESRRSGEIVRNLLLFARQGTPQLARANIDDILDRCLLLVRHHMEIGEVELLRERAAPAASPMLTCDRNQLQQVFVALLINAIEAMDGTPAPRRLRVAASGDADHLHVEVADSGVGIAAELAEHVFDPFFSTKEETKGVGLGLAVVLGIVQRHGGTIDFQDNAGAGTTFQVTLPRRPAEYSLQADPVEHTASVDRGAPS